MDVYSQAQDFTPELSDHSKASFHIVLVLQFILPSSRASSPLLGQVTGHPLTPFKTVFAVSPRCIGEQSRRPWPAVTLLTRQKQAPGLGGNAAFWL